MWRIEYLSQLDNLITLVGRGDFDTAKIEFVEYIKLIRNLGGYSRESWPVEWRRKIYEFGKLFTEDASWILNLIKEERSRGSFEALDFLHSEIIWNFFDNKNDYIKDEIKEFIELYPGNPEFHHTYAHVLEMNGNFRLAILEVKHALSQEKDNYIYLYSYSDKVKKYFDCLINRGNLDDAAKLLEVENQYYHKISSFQNDFFVKSNNNNTFSLLGDRLKDHVALEKKVAYFSGEIIKRIDIEQRRLIEVLGIFSGILGFILTSVSIGIKNLNVKDMIILMFCMALTLMIFSIVISYLFGKRERNKKFFYFLWQSKFWVLLLLIGILLAIIDKI